MTTPNQPQGGTPAVETAAPVTPAPDTPEYVAAMAAAYDGQGGAEGTQAPVVTEPAKADTETPPDPNAPAPKLTDKTDEPKEGEQKPDEPKEGEPKEGEQTEDKAKEPTQWAKAFEDGTFLTEFNAEKPNADFVKNLGDALGISPEQVTQMQEQFRAGQLALQRESTGKLYEAAGGQQGFNELVAWGQKNLTPEQQAFYDTQLNGPDAAETVRFLKQRMNATRDPNLNKVNGGAGGGVAAFRDQNEMIAAMSDPRYHTSPAYRGEVEQRMRLSNF